MAFSPFPVLFLLLPVIVLFSGMAMTPVLVLMLLLGILTARGQLLVWTAEERKQAQYLALLLVWPVLTGFWSITPPHSFETALSVAALCAMGFALLHAVPRLSKPTARTLTWAAGSFIVVGLLLLQEKLLPHGLIYQVYSLSGQDYERFMVKNINRGLCALTVLIWPLFFVLYQRHHVRKAWLTLAMLFCGILVFHSLSAKLGLAAGIAAFFLIRYRPRFGTGLGTLAIPLYLLAFVPVFILLQHTLFEEEKFFAFLLHYLPESSMHRLGIWHLLVHYLDGHWLLGWGMDSARALPMTHEELMGLGINEPPLHPHSPAFQILIEQGVIGLLLTVSGIFLLLREWRRMPAGLAQATLGALIVSYFVSGISSFGVWQSWWIATFWISLALWRWVRE